MCVSPHLALLPSFQGFTKALPGDTQHSGWTPSQDPLALPSQCPFHLYIFVSSGYREQQTLTNSRHSLTHQPVGHLRQDVTSHGKRRSPLCFRDQCGSESKQWQTVPCRWSLCQYPTTHGRVYVDRHLLIREALALNLQHTGLQPSSHQP